MKFIGDFHIHSRYSIATSKKLIPEYLDAWARIKGITVVGTGDFTHPGWTAELKEKLVPAEAGLFRLKDGVKTDPALFHPGPADKPVRFLLTAEISTIYKKDGRTRKVHNLVMAPDFAAVERIQKQLSKIGNITSDGRPILGLDSRDLLEICLDASEEICFVPAHIWTPWFSALGSKSGFDSIEHCYADLTNHIYAVETGLSADPPMHWMCSFLDRFTIISNSDAHSPEKLGREANLFDTELSYPGIMTALQENHPEQFLGTIEFFPEEGKYHYDGHRKCGVCWNPLQSLKHGDVCSKCGRPVTVGVMNRAAQLADRADPAARPGKRPYHSLVPLKEIISELEGVGPQSLRVAGRYQELIGKLGPELEILLRVPEADIARGGGTLLAEAVHRLRNRQVKVSEGFDGEYGSIRVFRDGEVKNMTARPGFFEAGAEAPPPLPRRPVISFDLAAFQAARRALPDGGCSGEPLSKGGPAVLNDLQRAAVSHGPGPALVTAGPGTGKTRVMTERIISLSGAHALKPEHILALTFTNKAADEIKNRLSAQAPSLFDAGGPRVSTFHALGYSIICEFDPAHASRPPDIIDERIKLQLLIDETGCDKSAARDIAARISAVRQRPGTADEPADRELSDLIVRYESRLQRSGLADLDDLICRPVRMLQSSADLRRTVQERYPWILVDEYQDINMMQYTLIRLLAPDGNAHLMVIGDPDQAIYGFRGADVTFIREFQSDYPGAAVYQLKKSYRCSDTILRASHAVVKQQKDNLLAGTQPGLNIRISRLKSGRSEAEFIARTIESLAGGLRFFSLDSGVAAGDQAEDITSLSDFAVLCRTARQMEPIEKALRDHAVPYQKAGSGSLFSTPPASVVLDFLRWSRMPENSFFTQLLTGLSGKPVTELDALRRAAAGASLPAAVELIAKALLKDADQDSLEALKQAAALWENDSEAFLRAAALGVETDSLSFTTEKVSLLTLHAAKGLEFTCVFIPGCEEGLLPYTLFETRQSDPEEERRLLYVGMTRAKKLLYLTHAETRTLYGRTLNPARSHFLDDIEARLLEHLDPGYTRRPAPDDSQLDIFT